MRLIRFLSVLLLATPLWATWTKTNDQSGGGTSNPQCAGTFTSALTNPSIIVVTVFRQTNTIATPTDTAGHTFVDSGLGVVSCTSCIGGAGFTAMFYALNTSTTASNIVCTADTVGDFIHVTAMEFTGGATISPVDVTNKTQNGSTGTGGGQNVTSTSTNATTTNGDLIVGLTVVNTGTLTVGTGFTASSDITTEYQVQSTAGAIAATWHDSANSDAYNAMMMALKPAAGGGPLATRGKAVIF